MTARGDKAAVVCAGRFYCDLIFSQVPRLPSLGTEVFAGGLTMHPGGGAYITAANLAALGHAVSLAAMLPNRPFDDAVAGELAASGSNLDLCRRLDPSSDPQITVAIAKGGERAFLSRRSGPACPRLTVSELSVSGAAHLHIGELATLIEQPDLIPAGRDAGMSISLDCSWDETISADDIGGLVSEVDVFLPNEIEARRLRGLGLREPFAPLTVVKKGASGAVAHRDGQKTEAAAQPISAVDTTGAGDAFNAGFLSAWLSGAALDHCLERGNEHAGREILRRGGSMTDATPADRRAIGLSK